jgi:hypothetical protein
MAGFQQIVDALGGVSVDIGKPIPIGAVGKVDYVLQPGVQRLTGEQALWFARSREGSSDYERMVRQKCLMSSLARQADPLTVLANYEQLATASASLVRTDIPTADLPEFVKLAQLAKGQAIEAVSLVPPLIEPARPDYGEIRAMVTRLLAGEPALGVEAATQAGGGDGSVGNPGSGVAAALQGGVAASDTGTAWEQASLGQETQPPPQSAADLGLVCQPV